MSGDGETPSIGPEYGALADEGLPGVGFPGCGERPRGVVVRELPQKDQKTKEKSG